MHSLCGLIIWPSAINQHFTQSHLTSFNHFTENVQQGRLGGGGGGIYTHTVRFHLA